MEPTPVRESVAALDAEGRRITIHPAEVRGRYTTVRKWLHGGLILFYLALPWIRFKGLPLVLLDVPQRRFVFFGSTFWAFDAPKLFFLVALLVFGLFFATALWGRVWCGYACPQTVFTESLFRRMESWIEGRAQERRRLDAFRRGSAEWFFKKGAKWVLFTVLAYAISLSFAAFFIGSEGVTRLILHPYPEDRVRALPGGGDLPAGFRLPPGTVLYRGLPLRPLPIGAHGPALADPRLRRRSRRAPGEGRGRRRLRGLRLLRAGVPHRHRHPQGAADGMHRLRGLRRRLRRGDGPPGAPPGPGGLHDGGRAGRPAAPALAGRTLAYAGVLTVLLGAMTFTLLTRRDLDVVPLRGLEAPCQEVKEGGADLVINHMRFMLTNLVPQERQLRMRLPAELEGKGFKLVTATNPLRPASTQQVRTDVFLTFPKSALVRGKATGAVEFVDGERVVERQELTLVGPFQ